ncbi:MAG TPA: redoxin family protein [Casimicrobiaceae bacterium]
MAGRWLEGLRRRGRIVHHGAARWLVALFVAAASAAGATAPAQFALAGDLFEHAPSPHALPDLAFVDLNGHPRHLSDFRGRVILLNLWATWCPPCRQELPTLDHLQALLGGPDFEVVALSIDRGGLAAVTSYFDQYDVRALHLYVDASGRALARVGGVALPTTLLIGRDGRELARHVGPVDWDRPDVVALLRGYIAAPRTTTPARARSGKELVLDVDDGKNVAHGAVAAPAGQRVAFIVSLRSIDLGRDIMRELLPGIFTWSRRSEAHGYDFNGYFAPHAQGNVCIDPVEPDSETLARLAELGVATIVLTNRNHSRAANAVRARTGARTLIHPADAERAQGPGTIIDGELAVGVAIGPFVVVDAAGKSPGEIALHWPARKILVVGDAIIGNPPGACSLVRESLTDDPPRLRRTVARLATLDFDALLVGDGTPILTDARAAVEALVRGFATT